MSGRGKRYLEVRKQVDRERLYDPVSAVALVKSTANCGFDETVEAHIRLGVDPRHADQQVRGTVQLPHGTGKAVRVVVFARDDKAKEAEQAGADIVGAEDLAEKIQQGFMDFDVAVATPDMMSIVGRLGRILGPRGMMPNPKAGTVTQDIKETVEGVKVGQIEFRLDKAAIVHIPVGKVSFTETQLIENLRALIRRLLEARPAAAKGQYIQSITIASTMGPGVKISPLQAFQFAGAREEAV